MSNAHRQALRYIIRNTSLPQRTRAQAQLQLSQMHCYTRPTQIRNRCIMGGKGRGVLRDFRMARVSAVAVVGETGVVEDEGIMDEEHGAGHDGMDRL